MATTEDGRSSCLPTRAQILACRMANASNALPEQFTGALIHLNTSLENPSRLPPAPRRERNWQRNARSVEGGRDLLDESGCKPHRLEGKGPFFALGRART
ncbi:hypothetical protein GE21DRAFT_1351361, partial [Neurospora crassa]